MSEYIEEIHVTKCDMCLEVKKHYYDGYIYNIYHTYSEYYLCAECFVLYEEIIDIFHSKLFKIKNMELIRKFVDHFNGNVKGE